MRMHFFFVKDEIVAVIEQKIAAWSFLPVGNV